MLLNIIMNEAVISQIAITAHSVNTAYAASIGDMNHKPWAQTDPGIRESVVEGVKKILTGEITTPRESHTSWMEYKVNDGWTYGPTKNVAAKTHPNLVDYDELPESEKMKDILFFAVVLSFTGEGIAIPNLTRWLA